MIKAKTKPVNKQKGSIFIALFFGIIILSATVFILIVTQNSSHPQQKTQTFLAQPTKTPQVINQNLNSSSLKPQENSNIDALDLNRILSEKYLTFEENTYGFSLQYPPEANLYHYTNSEVEMKGFSKLFSNSVLEKVTNISLSPIVSTVATEFYEGLKIDIFFLRNSNQTTLDQYVTNNTERKEEIMISGQKALKTLLKDPQILIYRYFLISNSQKYFIVLEVSPIGNDSELYEKVADKIINSINLY